LTLLTREVDKKYILYARGRASSKKNVATCFVVGQSLVGITYLKSSIANPGKTAYLPTFQAYKDLRPYLSSQKEKYPNESQDIL
jgi:hypothetical protein